jgi:exodeoxyribonuclease V gamma subunit
MIEAFHSNRLEVLAMHLGNIIQHDPTDVFQREVVLVESSAMSSWLTQQIALNNGIAADIEFPFPASFIWQIYRAQCLDLPQISQ